ncbi:MAG: PAS domain S-box protein, partial [Chlorobiota bacterium]
MASKVNLAETSVSILRTWFNFLPGMAYRCNNDHNWTMQIVSAGSFELTGYNPVDFIEQRVSYDTLILPEYREMVWKEIQNAVLERSHFTIEYRIKSKSGESKWVWEKGTGIFDDEGKLLFLEGYIADVTDRKEKEIELDTFFDIQPELLCISTRGGVFLKLNRAWEKKFGYGLDELIGESFKKLIHPDDLKVTVELDYITPDGVIPTFRNRYLTKDGKVVHLEWSAAIKDDKYYASARDISERVMLEKTITSRESLMRSMINSITESALLLETDGTIILCNRIAAERLGLQPEDLIKKNAFDLLPPDLAASRKERISEVIRTGSQVVFEDLRDGRAFL